MKVGDVKDRVVRGPPRGRPEWSAGRPVEEVRLLQSRSVRSRLSGRWKDQRLRPPRSTAESRIQRITESHDALRLLADADASGLPLFGQFGTRRARVDPPSCRRTGRAFGGRARATSRRISAPPAPPCPLQSARDPRKRFDRSPSVAAFPLIESAGLRPLPRREHSFGASSPSYDGKPVALRAGAFSHDDSARRPR